MPVIKTKGAASSQGFGEFAKAGVANYIEDVFSTYLYTGNSTSGGTQTITNNINLSTYGGLVWVKGRDIGSDNILTDTTRGAGASATNNNALASNLTSAEDLGGSSYDYLSSFSTTGFVVKQGGTTNATRGTNYNNFTYASWTFRKQPKFFDVITYTGNGGNRTIAHNLGSIPGCIIVKRADGTGNWQVYHNSLTSAAYGIQLNLTNAQASDTTLWNSTAPTSSVFSVGTNIDVNTNGATYVAYLFAHNAGGFGLTGTDNVISCGSYVGTGTVNTLSVNLGWEPQWVMLKSATTSWGWYINDNMRGTPVPTGFGPTLSPNDSAAEVSKRYVYPTATGFGIYDNEIESNQSGQTYIYIAIRRGPMKVPTSGASVFSPVARTGTGSATTITAGFPVDLIIDSSRVGGSGSWSNFVDRLRGNLARLTSVSTNAEQSMSGWDAITGFDSNTAVPVGTDPNGLINTVNNWANWMFRRAPGFFDEVCYTGTGVTTTFNHNLGVTPELMIFKQRSGANYWPVYNSTDGPTKITVLSATGGSSTSSTAFNNTAPTSSVFTVGTLAQINTSSQTYVAYLFATCAGVSKVGSYTGNGSTQTINCGFTSGARFVLIKNISATGSWYVYDTARGMTSSTDPFLYLQSTSAETATLGSVTTVSSGFALDYSAEAGINLNGYTYLYLAIA